MGAKNHEQPDAVNDGVLETRDSMWGSFTSMLTGGTPGTPAKEQAFEMTDAEWRKKLSRAEYQVMRKKYMEKPETIDRSTFEVSSLTSVVTLTFCKSSV